MSIKLKFIFAGMFAAFGVALPAMADDIEIYTTSALGATAVVEPNIMFLVDTSVSMSTVLSEDSSPITYDYTIDYGADPYTGSCDPDIIYFTADLSSIPSCGGGNKDWVNESALVCDAAKNLYDHTQDPIIINAVGPLESAGTFTDQLAQLDGNTWQAVDGGNNANADEKDMPIECKVDAGYHGNTNITLTYIEDSATGWTQIVPNSPHPVYNITYKLFHSNYLNYLQSLAAGTVGPSTTSITRLDVVKEAIFKLVESNNNFRLGLMIFDNKTDQWEGGSVQFPSLSTTLTRNDFRNRLGGLDADGMSELSETYYEALLYFGGRDDDYANAALPQAVIRSSTYFPGNVVYRTPIIETCQKNYIVVVSDGSPMHDYVSSARHTNLASGYDFKCNTDDDPDPDHDGFLGTTGTTVVTAADFNKNALASAASTNDNCLDEFAEWAHDNDVAQRSDTPAHVGEQTIGTYTVGFDFDGSDPDMAAAEQLLRDTASAGGGDFIEANDQASLDQAFSRIVSEILAVNATFSSPAVSVNAFNRATNLDDLFFTLFKPTDFEHWEGNLKKFKLEFDANGVPIVADKNSVGAIDVATGFFKDTSESYWTLTADAPDGAETALGGAAGMLSLTRNVYTFTGTYSGTAGVLTPSVGDITAASNELIFSNTNITDTMLGGVDGYTAVDYYDAGVLATTPYSYHDALLKWAFGYDIKDDDGDLESLEARRIMGDPLHAEPALVQYGQLTDGEPDLVAYVATNDGYLHAFNTISGTENFAFVPQEMLPKLQNIFDDTGVNGKAYGLDGNVVSWINDVNNDGTISGTGEHVYLYFGMRRGGRYIYSMDVTNRNSPTLRWVIEGGSGDYAELGQTWSAPNIEKIKTGPNPEDFKIVLIFGAGYDTAQDAATTRDSTTADSVGRGVYIVDATTGALLWSAGPNGTDNLQLADMKYSIPARIKPLDVDGDGYVDQLYAGDMGGQLWRFDIDNAANTTSSLSVTGGRVADFAADNLVTDNRRFYNPPDVAQIIEQGQAPYLAIIAASGYRAHPLQTATHDRVYMIRDYDVYTAPATYTTLTEADLYDTTNNLIGEGTTAEIVDESASLSAAKGWFITFSEMDGSFVGEKALSEPLILNGVAIFTTYIPASAGLNINACIANDGTGAIYFVNTVDGTPTSDNNTDSTTTREDRRILLTRGGIPPTPRIIITSDGIPTLCVGTECTKAGDVGTVQKMYWYEVEE